MAHPRPSPHGTPEHCREIRKLQPTWGAQEDGDLLGLYVKGVALQDIADRLGWAPTTVQRHMARLNLERLPQGRQPGSRSSDHCDQSKR